LILKKAKKIRELYGLSRSMLAMEFEDPRRRHPRGVQSITEFEEGRRIPKFSPTKGGISKDYLIWLAKHGYDPYNLKEDPYLKQ